MALKRETRQYSLLFPFWLLILKPSFFWLLLLPVNFIWDSLVLIFTLKLLHVNGLRKTWKKAILKVFLLGILVDLIGAALLLLSWYDWGSWWREYIAEPILRNPYDNWYALLYTVLVLLCSALLIYLLNRHITFRRIDLEKNKKRIVSLMLAVLSAPYFFLLPAGIFDQQSQGLYFFTNHIAPEETELVQIAQYSDGKETAEANVYLNSLLIGAVNHALSCDALPEEVEKEFYCLRFIPKKEEQRVDVWLYLDASKRDQLYFTYDEQTFRILEEDEGEILELLDSLIENGFSYHYTLVDQSVVADQTPELIAEDEDYDYYLSSVRSNHIILCFENGEVLSLPEALDKGLVDIYDLIRNGLDVIIRPIGEPIESVKS